MDLDLELATATVDRIWDESALPALVDYIRIPAKSPAYDVDWSVHGHLAEAVDLVAGWCRSRALPGATVEVIEQAGRTPVVLVEVPAHGAGDPVGGPAGGGPARRGDPAGLCRGLRRARRRR